MYTRQKNKCKHIGICLLVMLLLTIFPCAAFASDTMDENNEMQQLGTPTNLRWNVNAYGEEDYRVISWDAVENANQYYVEIYTEDGELIETDYVGDYSETGIVSYEIYQYYIEESHNYYFTVKATDYNEVYADSEVATSDVWEYTEPPRMDTPTNLKWNENQYGQLETGTIVWDAVDGADNYELILYSADGTVLKSDPYVYGGNDYGGIMQYLGLLEDVENPDGCYFTVKGMNYDGKYLDSEAAISDPYAAPPQLDMPTGLKWHANLSNETEYGTVRWNAVENATHYNLEIYTEDGTYVGSSYASAYYGESASMCTDIMSYLKESGRYYFTVQADSYTGEYLKSEFAQSEVWEYIMPEQLETPTNLSWNTNENGEFEAGVVSWDTVEGAKNYEFALFNERGTRLMLKTVTTASVNVQEKLTQEGGYYFTVIAIGDKVNYQDSDKVTSEIYQFALPDEKLATPANLNWNVNQNGEYEYGVISWDAVEGASEYSVLLCNEDGYNIGDLFLYEISDTGIVFYDIILNHLQQEGSYYFTVQAIGDNINYLNSDIATSAMFEFTPAPKLDTPTNLKWNINENGETEYGLISWKGVDNATEYIVRLYNDDGRHIDSSWVDIDENSDTLYCRGLLENINVSGDYYVTIQAIGDVEHYNDSDLATSSIWQYTLPETKFPAPQNLKWDVNAKGETEYAAITWDSIQNAKKYEVYLYTEDGISLHGYQTDKNYIDSDEILSELEGEGGYYYTVRVLGDKVNYLNSNIVASEIWQYEKPDNKLSAPENLRWNINNYGEVEYGAIMWDPVTNATCYAVKIYTDDGESMGTRTTTATYIDGDTIMIHINGSDGYYFTVQAIGDGVKYQDSEIAASSVWQYNKPSAYLSDPTNLFWNVNAQGNTEYGVISWEEVPNARDYMVILYNEDDKHITGYKTDETEWDISSYLTEPCGYYFTVKALGDKITYLDSKVITSTIWQYVEPNGQLAAPTNLKWNVNHAGETEYGYVSFDTVVNCEGEYDITVYKDGEAYEMPCGWSSVVGYNDIYEDTAYLDFRDQIFESGTYTFSVQAIGDGVNYKDSEPVHSDEFVYVRPSAELGTTTDLKWVGTNRYWKPVENAAYYWIFYYKGEELLGASYESPRELAVDGDWVYTTDEWFFDLIERHGNGEGKFSFKIEAYSEDITKVANGDISAMSPVTDIGQTAQNVNNTLEGLNTAIDAGNISATEARADLLTEDSGNLAAALAAKDEVVQNMGELESSYMTEQTISVAVDVTGEAANNGVADASKIEITGAALNSSVAGDEVSFNISKSKSDYPIHNALQYKNTVFMDMNLTGDGINPDGSLSVPVYIKMPVPSNITVPDRFRILHFLNSAGDYELVVPAITKEGGTYYASFILTHFSPFAFTEVLTQDEMENGSVTNLKGDVNLSGKVDMDDVVALLNHVVKANTIIDSEALALGEVTNDVDLNMDDVVKLLNYVVKAIDSLD